SRWKVGESLLGPEIRGVKSTVDLIFKGNNIVYLAHEDLTEHQAWADALCIEIRDRFQLKRAGRKTDGGWYPDLSAIAGDKVLPFKEEVERFRQVSLLWTESRRAVEKAAQRLFLRAPKKGPDFYSIYINEGLLGLDKLKKSGRIKEEDLEQLIILVASKNPHKDKAQKLYDWSQRSFGKVDDKRNLISHFKKRLRERYGLLCSDPEYYNLCKRLSKNDRVTLIRIDRKTKRHVCRLDFKGKEIKVVYEKQSNMLITALPAQSIRIMQSDFKHKKRRGKQKRGGKPFKHGRRRGGKPPVQKYKESYDDYQDY
ncbi:MAG: hypothetical protein ACXABY_17115, partial [Candidatus Thorarchaeota archaeon]